MLKLLADVRIEKQELTSEYYEQETLEYSQTTEDISY
jgi:hypothetical protein